MIGCGESKMSANVGNDVSFPPQRTDFTADVSGISMVIASRPNLCVASLACTDAR
jgi:hypothetical protein